MYLSGISILIGLIALGTMHPALGAAVTVGLILLWRTC